MQSHRSKPFTLVRAGGIAALSMALCYFITAGIFLGWLVVPQDLDILGRVTFMQQHYLLLVTGYSVGYLLFGVLLSVLLQALQRLQADTASTLAELAGRFGNVWVVLVLSTGMLAIIAQDRVFALIDLDQVQAEALYHSSSLMIYTLGGGIELVAGVWVLLLSLSGLAKQRFSWGLNVLGVLVGLLGISTLMHQAPYLKEAFGLLQLIWFIGLGWALLSGKSLK